MSDSGVLLTSQVLTVVATSIAAVSVARTLAPDDWGLFSAFLGLSAALALIADFGLGTWLLREFSRLAADVSDESARSRAGELLGAGLAINVVLAGPLVMAAIAWSIAARPAAPTAVALVSLLVYGALTASANAFESYMRSLRLVGLVFRASLLEKLILVVLLLSVLATDAGLAAIGLAYVLAGTTRVTFDAVILLRRLGLPFRLPQRAEMISVARASLPLAANAGSLNLIPRLDTLVLVAMSATTAAWFAVGDRALGPALLIPAVLGSTLYPFLSPGGTRHRAPWRVACLLGIAGATLAALGMILAPFLIPLLFGNAYADATPVIRIMLLILPLVFTASPLLVFAYSAGRERSLLGPIAAISLAGTGAIALGQVLGGPELAAVGYVFRQCLFLLAVGTVAIAASRQHGHATGTEREPLELVSEQHP